MRMYKKVILQFVKIRQCFQTVFRILDMKKFQSVTVNYCNQEEGISQLYCHWCLTTEAE